MDPLAQYDTTKGKKWLTGPQGPCCQSRCDNVVTPPDTSTVRYKGGTRVLGGRGQASLLWLLNQLHCKVTEHSISQLPPLKQEAPPASQSCSTQGVDVFRAVTLASFHWGKSSAVCSGIVKASSIKRLKWGHLGGSVG